MSAEGLLPSALALFDQPIDLTIAVEEYKFNRPEAALAQTNSYNPEAQLTGLFEGVAPDSPIEPDDRSGKIQGAWLGASHLGPLEFQYL